MVTSRIGKNWEFREELHDSYYYDYFADVDGKTRNLFTVQVGDGLIMLFSSIGYSEVLDRDVYLDESIKKAEDWMEHNQSVNKILKEFPENKREYLRENLI